MSTRAASATTILPLDLEALTSAAGRVFRGRVVAVRSGRDGHGLPATWTTFTVDEALKGTATPTVEIKQLGTDGALSDGSVFRVPALPSYRVGDEVVLFLHPESVAGFTSPVGFGQGRFRVRREGDREVAENDVGNRNLAAPGTATPGAPRGRAGSMAAVPQSDTAARPPGRGSPIPVDELLTRIRALTGAAD